MQVGARGRRCHLEQYVHALRVVASVLGVKQSAAPMHRSGKEHTLGRVQLAVSLYADSEGSRNGLKEALDRAIVEKNII